MNTKRSPEATNQELISVLEECARDNVDISVRAVVRRMNSISQPSSITRNEYRRELVEKAKQKQEDTRLIAARIAKGSAKTDKERIVMLEQQLADALNREKQLHASLLAMIKAAAIQGVDWVSFYQKYSLELPDGVEGQVVAIK